MWAAMAVYDGGGTTERQLRSACPSLGVAYWRPEFERFNFFGTHLGKLAADNRAEGVCSRRWPSTRLRTFLDRQLIFASTF